MDKALFQVVIWALFTSVNSGKLLIKWNITMQIYWNVLLFLLTNTAVGIMWYMTSNSFTSCFNTIETSVAEATHVLQYFYTLTLDQAGRTNFVSVGVLDGVQIDRYDSKSERDVPIVDWMSQEISFWDAETEARKDDQGRFFAMMKDTFNHSSG